MKHIGRKLYHLIGGLILLSLVPVLGRERALVAYAFLFCLVLALDTARLRIPAFNRFMLERFGSFIRPREATKYTGTAPYVLGIALTVLFYRAEIAYAAVCFLAFGDVAATTVGERFGRTKIAGEKSLEGTLAFIAAALFAGFLLGLAGVHPGAALIVSGVLAAAGVELLPLPLNDNLVIPLVSGGVMALVARALGQA